MSNTLSIYIYWCPARFPYQITFVSLYRNTTVSLEELKLFILPEYLSSSQIFSGVRVTQALVLCDSLSLCPFWHIVTSILLFTVRLHNSIWRHYTWHARYGAMSVPPFVIFVFLINHVVDIIFRDVIQWPSLHRHLINICTLLTWQYLITSDILYFNLWKHFAHHQFSLIQQMGSSVFSFSDGARPWIA